MIANNRGLKVQESNRLADLDVQRDTGIQRWSKGFNKKKDRKCAHGLPYDDDSIICPACEIEVSEE